MHLTRIALEHIDAYTLSVRYMKKKTREEAMKNRNKVHKKFKMTDEVKQGFVERLESLMRKVYAVKVDPKESTDSQDGISSFEFGSEESWRVPSLTVAGYASIGSELDVWPMLQWLFGREHTVGLPNLIPDEQNFSFLTWNPAIKLVLGKHNLPVPPIAKSAPVVPELLLVPLLQFDRQGFRLGYGTGRYDRTIQQLRTRWTKLDKDYRLYGTSYEQLVLQSSPRMTHWMHPILDPDHPTGLASLAQQPPSNPVLPSTTASHLTKRFIPPNQGDPNVAIPTVSIWNGREHQVVASSSMYNVPHVGERRPLRPLVVCGVAYSEQEVDTMPIDNLDEVLDCVITDKELIIMNEGWLGANHQPEIKKAKGVPRMPYL